MNINIAQVCGRLTKDPEVKETTNGAVVARFSIATNHTFKKADGTKSETVQFHNIVAWGKTAELIKQYVFKGHELYVRGRIEYRTWETKEGQKRTTTEIVVEDMQFGAKPRGESVREVSHPSEASEAIEDEIDMSKIPF